MLNWTASPVEVYVHRACDPSLREPNYALNLELAEYINTKKANTPREAAMNIARLVNHRNPHVSVLALMLLSTLVQSCGYPFHLQISTKEFLNELVRRFPERPPPFPGPIMSRILDMIHLWKETICKDSRFKEDFGNIRDMYRLLSFKGYRFRDVGQNANVAAQDTSVNLKSPEELEAEDREAQSAKLQELIRRGTPRDLQAAQELMKTLAGANPEAKPDYRSKTLNELEKLQSHVILLNDMLDNVDPAKPERLVQGDAYDQVAVICRNARPKIQKWISNAETDDPESLDTFLSINDLINNVLDRYERYKKGDYSQQPQPEAQKTSDLINFDADQSSSTAPGIALPSSPANDLEALFGSLGSPASAPSSSTSQPQPQRQGIFLGSPPLTSPSTPIPTIAPTAPSLFQSMSPPSYSAASQPQAQPVSLWNNAAPALTPTPTFGAVAQPSSSNGAVAHPGTTSAPPPKKDPFADLEGLW